MLNRLIKAIGILISSLSGVYLLVKIGRVISTGVETPNLLFQSGGAILAILIGIEITQYSNKLIHLFKRARNRLRTNEAYRHQKIRDEIFRRILHTAEQNSVKVKHQEEIAAILDALAKVVDLSKAEMERIAEEVRDEFPPPSNSPAKRRPSLVYWPLIFSLLATAIFARRGSPFYLATGTIFLIFLIRFLSQLLSKLRDK